MEPSGDYYREHDSQGRRSRRGRKTRRTENDDRRGRRRSRNVSGERRSHAKERNNDLKPYDMKQITSFASLSDLTETSSELKHRGDPHSDYDEDIYVVKQRHGYFSILFSTVQVIVLAAMMWQCGIAPFNLNPMLGPYPDALSYWGAKNTVLIVDDEEYWRLVTPIFLHAGIIHLMGNVAVQMETGVFFEREWGSPVWFVIYIMSALGSSILSCISMPDSISVGSSGAVMGLFGAKLSEVFCLACAKRVNKQDDIAYNVRMEQLQGVLCSVTVVGLFSFIPYVDWAAHLGGLIAGITVGLIIFSTKIKSWCWGVVWFALGFATTIIAFAYAVVYLLNNVDPSDDLRDVCEYYKQYFENYECNCQLEADE